MFRIGQANVKTTIFATTTKQRMSDDDDFEQEEEEEEDDDDYEEKEAAMEEEEQHQPANKAATKRSASSSSSSPAKSLSPSTKRSKKESKGSAAPKELQLSTLQFLRDLKLNNDRDWMREHKGTFETARENMYAFVDDVQALVRGFDATVKEEEPKNMLFRINRDIRFSASKEPYKTSFGAVLSRGGRKSAHACYYVHVEPDGHSFVGGGLWHPQPAHLNAIRAAIASDPAEIKRVVKDKTFQQYFGKNPFSTEDALKTAPKGYDKVKGKTTQSCSLFKTSSHRTTPTSSCSSSSPSWSSTRSTTRRSCPRISRRVSVRSATR